MLSDKVLNIPELGDEGLLFARPGFNVIGTANTRDQGVNEMSSALKRRFNFETRRAKWLPKATALGVKDLLWTCLQWDVMVGLLKDRDMIACLPVHDRYNEGSLSQFQDMMAQLLDQIEMGCLPYTFSQSAFVSLQRVYTVGDRGRSSRLVIGMSERLDNMKPALYCKLFVHAKMFIESACYLTHDTQERSCQHESAGAFFVERS